MSDASYASPELNEIPVWVRGEQRWISGLSEETTCGQLVEALLRDEGLHGGAALDQTDTNDILNQYVISEKWRRVEQILSRTTKVLQIWTAWGESQSQVCYSCTNPIHRVRQKFLIFRIYLYCSSIYEFRVQYASKFI